MAQQHQQQQQHHHQQQQHQPPPRAPPLPPRLQRLGARSGRLGLGLLVGFVGLGMGPVAWMFLSPSSRVNADRPLPSQAAVRGAYVNAGSQDAGPDRPLRELARESERGGGGGKEEEEG
jgi:hypothetical protein